MSAWDDSHKHIFTYTEIEVLEALRGASNAGHTMVLRTLGGEVGEVGMAVAGTAKFREGEEVVVFLRDDPVRAGDFQVIGMSQGKYRVKRTDGLVVLEPGLEGVAFARAGANGTLRVDPTTPGPGQVTLQELKRRVSAVAQPTKPAVKSPGSPTGQANPNTTPATPAAPVPQKTTRGPRRNPSPLQSSLRK